MKLQRYLLRRQFGADASLTNQDDCGSGLKALIERKELVYLKKLKVLSGLRFPYWLNDPYRGYRIALPHQSVPIPTPGLEEQLSAYGALSIVTQHVQAQGAQTIKWIGVTDTDRPRRPVGVINSAARAV